MPPELVEESVELETEVTPQDGPQDEANPEPAPEPAEGESDDEKVHRVPQSEFKRLKTKARDKGRSEALAEITEKVKAAGFESLDEALAQIPDLKSQVEALTQAQKEPEEKKMPEKKKPAQKQRTGRMSEQSAKEIARLERERVKERERWRREEKRRKSAEKNLAAKEAEIEIREKAIAAGCTDVDYAVRLMIRHINKEKPDLESFSEEQFFADMKEKKPYLFGEERIPATTGTSASEDDTPAEPAPGEVMNDIADAEQFDARTASKEDYDKRMRELGLRTSGVRPI